MANAEIIVKIVDQTSAGANSVQRNLNNVGKSTGSVTTKINTFAQGLAGLATTFATVGTAGINFLDTVQTLDNRLKLVTDSQEDLNETFDALVDVSNRSRAPLQETAELYTRIGLAADTVGISADEALVVTENFNKVLSLSGSTGQEASSAILQFSQALASGTLRGDEFRSITEAAPVLLQLLEKQLGVTRAQLREYASDGLLNAELVTRTLIAATGELDQKFGETDVTISQATTQISNSFLEVVRSFDAVTGASSVVSESLQFIANNMELMLTVGGTLAAVVGGTLVVAVGGFVASVIGIPLAIGGAIAAVVGLVTSFDGLLDSINGVIDAMVEFATGVVQDFIGGLKGLWAAIKDPLNATEAYTKAVEEHSKELEDAAKVNEEFTNTVEDVNEVTEEGSDTTDTNTEAVDNNSDAVNENERRLNELREELRKQTEQTEDATKAYDDFSSEMERSIALAQMDQREREIQQQIYRGLEARAKDLETQTENLSDTERAQVEKRVRELTELRMHHEDTNELIRQNYENTTDAIEQLEKEKQDYIQRARELGLENEQATQDAILAYNNMIYEELEAKHKETIDAVTSKAEQYRDDELGAYGRYHQQRLDLQKAMDDGIIISEEDRVAYLKQLNKEYADEMATEYNDLYGLFSDKITDMTGLSRQEFGIMEEIVQLTFGVNVTDVIKGTFAAGIGSILGFRSEGTDSLVGFANDQPTIFNFVGDAITSAFSGTGLGSIGAFVAGGFELLGGLASDIFKLFGGVGDFLGNTFGGAFKSISGAISNLFGGMGGGGGSGGIFGAIGSLFGPVGGVIGGIVDFFFADGGYIKPGQIGVVGEAGAEIVRGPAHVTSVTDTQEILSGVGRAQSVNVNFNIQALDARGVDQILSDRRELLVDVIRQGINERPTIRSIY